MNRIKVEEDKIILKDLNDKIDLVFEPKNEMFSVNKIILKVKKSTSLKIEYSGIIEGKLDIVINLLKDVKLNLTEYRNGRTSKIRYSINIDKNSNLNSIKVYDVEKIREVMNVNLNGENASFNYIFKTISKNTEKYDLSVHHNASNTISNIDNNGINIKKGTLIFNVLGIVPNNIVNCDLNQSNRIINFTNNLCQINPNLYIDENDVIANHSAYIGNFNENEIFYLMRLGISYEQAIILLIKGFMLKNINKSLENKVKSVIKKYWR